MDTLIKQERPHTLVIGQESSQFLHQIDVSTFFVISQTVNLSLYRVIIAFRQLIIQNLLVDRCLRIKSAGVQLLRPEFGQVTKRSLRYYILILIITISLCRITIANQQLLILIIQELAPSVGGALQEVIEALVILHQVGEDMLLSILLDMLHKGIIIPRYL